MVIELRGDGEELVHRHNIDTGTGGCSEGAPDLAVNVLQYGDVEAADARRGAQLFSALPKIVTNESEQLELVALAGLAVTCAFWVWSGNAVTSSSINS